jgi:hypothetical protein
MMEPVDSGAQGDLFGRDRAGAEASLSRITSIRVSGKEMKNTLFAQALFLRVYDGASFDELFAIDPVEGFAIDMAGDGIPMPFKPQFALYAEKPKEGTSVTIKIEPKKNGADDAFSMKLSVDVAGEAEYEQNL